MEDKRADQKQIKALESLRNAKRKTLFEAQDAIDQRREQLIGAIKAKPARNTNAAAVVGGFQTFALFPGISRSGVAIVGGILAGLSYEEACRFAFMLATPVIGAAGLLKAPALFEPEAQSILRLTIPAALAAGVTAYLSTAFLMKYFQTRRLAPFAVYCVLLGALTLVMLHH